MSNFLDKALELGAELPENVIKTAEELEAEKIANDEAQALADKAAEEKAEADRLAAEGQEKTAEEIQAEKDAEEARLKAESQPTKKEIDYSSFLTENEKTLREYLNEKNTDYKALPALELVKRKISAENPEFDSEDVTHELEDKYGIGLSLIEIDEDVMEPEEVAAAKRENKLIEKEIAKGARALKKDSAQAAEYFEQQKQSLTLPKFEVEEETVQQENFSPEKYQEDLVEQAIKNKEEYWIPQLKQVIDPLESLTEQVEYEDNGNKVVLNVDYKLSKEEKSEIQEELNEYIASARDSKYVDAQGNPDLQRFVQDKAKEIHFKKLLKTVAKEAAATARKEFVKNDLLNFDDGTKQRQMPDNDEPFDRGLFKAAKAQSDNRL